MTQYTPFIEEVQKRLRFNELSDEDFLDISLDATLENFICRVTACSLEARYFHNRFPESKYDWDLGGFIVPCTDISAAILDAWPKGQLRITGEAFQMLKSLILEAQVREICAKRTALFKEKSEVPQHEWEINQELPLMPHQETALCNVMSSESYALFMEQGTGKTPIMVAAICNMAKRKERKTPADLFRALIVCPKQVRLNWQEEFQRFATARGIIVPIRGGKMARVQRLLDVLSAPADRDFVCAIMNYDSLRVTWEALQMIPWDCVVLDESHYIKNPGAKRSRLALKLRDRAERRYVLTGTPIANTPMDLYMQLEFLVKGGSGFSSFNAFQDFYGVFEDRGGHNTLVDFQNLPFLRDRMARMSFIVKKQEVLTDLPEKVYDVLEAEMTSEQKDIYQQLANQLAAEIEDELSGEVNQVTVNNILTKLLRLAQVTSGFIKYDDVYDDDGTLIRPGRVDRFDPNPKLEILVEELKQRPAGSKTIIWSSFVQSIKQIQARLRLEGIDCVTFWGGVKDADRMVAIERFNKDPNCRVFIGNPAAGGAGLNLLGYDYTDPRWRDADPPTATDWVVYFNNSWSSTNRRQSEDRCHRTGTKRQVRYTDLMVPGTIDEVIRQRLDQKKQRAETIEDVRQILSLLVSMEV